MKDATTDTAIVRSWWAENAAALIGCRIPTNMMVLDLDPRHGGDATWAELERHFGDIQVAMSHASGRGDGGRHLWFARPDGRLNIKRLAQWAKANGVGQQAGKRSWTSGIDILHHGHRYTILPPSPHPTTGNPYRWLTQDDPRDAPGFLVHLITKDPEPERIEPSPALRLVKDADSIADWYSANHSWHDILPGLGWFLVAGDGDSDNSKWRHPNASAESSASVRHGCLFVYTDSTDFDPTEEGDPHGYTRFRAYSIIEHAGDLTAAAKAAFEMRDGPDNSYEWLVEQCAKAQTEPPMSAGAPIANDDELEHGWEETDWSLVDASKWPTPSQLAVTDQIGGTSRHLFYPGRIHMLFGESGAGKSWVALQAAIERIEAGEHVIWIDYEDSAMGLEARFLALGGDQAVLRQHVHYIQPQAKWNRRGRDYIESLIALTNATLVVLDSTGEALASEGLKPSADEEVAAWAVAVLRFMERLGLTVVIIDHVVKDPDGPKLYSIGSQRKRAMIDGAAYRIDQVQAFAIGKGGKAKITTAKDRWGASAQGQCVAELIVTPGEGVNVSLALVDPMFASGDTPEADKESKFNALMERVWKAIDESPMSQSEAEQRISGRAANVRVAVKTLLERGHLRKDGTTLRVQTAYSAPNPIAQYVNPSHRPTPSRTDGTMGRGPKNPSVPSRLLYGTGGRVDVVKNETENPSQADWLSRIATANKTTTSSGQTKTPTDTPAPTPYPVPDF
jgi:hypothetical protein